MCKAKGKGDVSLIKVGELWCLNTFYWDTWRPKGARFIKTITKVANNRSGISWAKSNLWNYWFISNILHFLTALIQVRYNPPPHLDSSHIDFKEYIPALVLNTLNLSKSKINAKLCLEENIAKHCKSPGVCFCQENQHLDLYTHTIPAPGVNCVCYTCPINTRDNISCFSIRFKIKFSIN